MAGAVWIIHHKLVRALSGKGKPVCCRGKKVLPDDNYKNFVWFRRNKYQWERQSKKANIKNALVLSYNPVYTRHREIVLKNISGVEKRENILY